MLRHRTVCCGFAYDVDYANFRVNSAGDTICQNCGNDIPRGVRQFTMVEEEEVSSRWVQPEIITNSLSVGSLTAIRPTPTLTVRELPPLVTREDVARLREEQASRYARELDARLISEEATVSELLDRIWNEKIKKKPASVEVIYPWED